MRQLSEVATIKSVNPKKGFTEGAVFIQAVGDFAMIDKPDSFTGIIEVVPGPEVIKDYLFQILKKPLREYGKLKKDQVIKKLFLVDVKNIEIPVPTLERQQKLLKSKNVEHRFIKFWLESGVRTYDEPLVVNMSFNELLKRMKLPPKK